MNPLAPTLDPVAATASPQLAALSQAHDMARSRFLKTGQVMDRVDKIRTELTTLAKLGDTVTPEDVIKGAGKLVASGMDPMQMASLLADMPTNGGVALANWVAQHAQAMTQKEAQFGQVHAQARHESGVAALRLLAGHTHASLSGATPSQAAPMPMANQLNSSSPSQEASPNAD